MTSAPRSASNAPHVGPAMIWASSRTRSPASGPVCGAGGSAALIRAPHACGFATALPPRGSNSRLGTAPRRSSADESGLALGEERRVADAEVLGVETVEAFVALGIRQRPRVLDPAREFLVPARDQRRAVGDAFGGRTGFGGDLGVG